MKQLDKKDFWLIANKLIKNIHDLCNAREYYKSFLIKENRKSVNVAEVIAYQPIPFFKTQKLLILNQLLQNIQKRHINYLRL